jgi:hypothetical protein
MIGIPRKKTQGGDLLPINIPPDPARSTPAQRRQWMIRFSRFQTRMLALEHLLTNARYHALQVEQFGVVTMHGYSCGAPHNEIIAVANAEWALALLYCEDFLDHLRRTLWSMCRANAPRRAIIDTAYRAFIAADIGIDDDRLMVLIGDIWNGARPRPPHRPQARRRGRR